MYLFNTEKKQDILKGRTIRYLADNIVACSEVHLGNILRGETTCSYLLAKNITECAEANAKIEDYFTKTAK